MKKLIILSVLIAGVMLVINGCCCCDCCKSEDKCAMCNNKVKTERCLQTQGGKVCYPCAKHCMMCPKCKTVLTPDEMKACNCKGKCTCGMKLEAMGKMKPEDMSKLQKDQAKCQGAVCPADSK